MKLFAKIFTAFLFLYANASTAQLTDIVTKSEMTGAWYNTGRSGEGLLIEILNNDRALVTFFTYDLTGNQVWLIGVGEIEGNKITNVTMTITSGAKFGDAFEASDVVRTDWGELLLEFFSCSTGKLTYSTNSVYESGEILISRLTSIQNHACNDKRDFLMGFTPFPSEVSQTGIDTAYQIIDDHADIIAHHFDDGIPWPEMLAGASFEALPDAVKQDWLARKAKTNASKKVYLAITPIAISRDQLAPYKGETADTPLSVIGEPWVSANFDHPDVIKAYKNYAKTAVEFFKPDYLAIGIEVNILSINTPEKWQNFLRLNQQTYLYLHQLYPTLPIFTSFFANDYYPGITESDPEEQIARFREIEPYTDYFALSVYPYISDLLTNEVPTDYFKVLDKISKKPLAIAESGYLAESVSLDFGNGNIINFEGSEQKQQDWIKFLLEQSEQRDFKFVINFINKDYDLLCQQIECEDVLRLWEDTGLIDENDMPRPALSTWDKYLQKEFQK